MHLFYYNFKLITYATGSKYISVDIATIKRGTPLRTLGSIPGAAKNFFFHFHKLQTRYGTHTDSRLMSTAGQFIRGKSGRGMNLTNRLQLLPKLKISADLGLRLQIYVMKCGNKFTYLTLYQL
jgi:hypothetical protein